MPHPTEPGFLFLPALSSTGLFANVVTVVNDSDPSPDPQPSAPTRTWTTTDALLLLTVTLWGVNYSIIKVVIRSIPPNAFNSARLVISSVTFLLAIAISYWLRHRARSLRSAIVDLTPGGQGSLSILRAASAWTRRDVILLVILGLVGHMCYQMCFMGGMARTSVSNAALIIGCTPIAVALASAALGQDKLGPMHWIGAALSLSGIYFVVGWGARTGGASLTGDLLTGGAVICWAAYTLLGKELLKRHSPLIVTGYSFTIGTLGYLPYGWRDVAATDWTAIGRFEIAGILYSALLTLNLAYLLWYAGVQRLGSARTAVYSNLVPIVALFVATVGLGEPLTPIKIAGAAAVITGLALTRVQFPLRTNLRPEC